jgi:hypothetical protein
MFNTLIFALSMLVQSPNVSACEWVGPRIDGISVKVCAGEVKAYRDQLGNVRTVGSVQ